MAASASCSPKSHGFSTRMQPWLKARFDALKRFLSGVSCRYTMNLFGKLKLHVAERIAIARRLGDRDGAVTLVMNDEPGRAASTVGSCASAGKILFLHDRLRDVPGRIDPDDILDRVGEDRSCHARLADDDPGRPRGLAVSSRP